MKKITNLLLGIFMLFAITINVHAVTITTNTTSGTIDSNSKHVTNTSTLTVEGVQSTETFKAYKIMDVFYNSTNNGLTYEFTSAFKSFLATTGDYKNLSEDEYQALTSGTTTNGSTTTSSTLDTLASLYASYIKTNNVSGTNMTVSGSNATATLEVGAWLVLPVTTTRVYAVMVGNIELKVSSNGADWDITSPTITAKVSSTSVSKVLKDTGDTWGTYGTGDIFSYVITASVPTYPTNATNKTLSIKETLDSGIVLGNIGEIIVSDGGVQLTTKPNGTVVDGANHTVATITQGESQFTVNFNADYLTSNTVTIEYPASLGGDVVLGPSGNNTTTLLTYTSNPYGTGTTDAEEVINTVFTYGIMVHKKDSDNHPLNGAVFTVYSDASLTNAVGTITTGTNGSGSLELLKRGTYYLKETTAPFGFKIAKDIQTVTIGENTGSYAEVDLVNEKIGLLPSTGGVGTYIFIIVGAIVVIGALVFLYKYFNQKKK